MDTEYIFLDLVYSGSAGGILTLVGGRVCECGTTALMGGGYLVVCLYICYGCCVYVMYVCWAGLGWVWLAGEFHEQRYA